MWEWAKNNPCLKLFDGCPIMVTKNDSKNLGAV
jgi:hypothetical protein